MSRPNCAAKHQGGNEYRCDRCNFTWDTDDPEPPKCKTDVEVNHERGRRHLKKIRENLSHDTKTI